MPEFDYDAFLSHASEDKSTFVEPLAHELTKLGLKVWYDRFSLRVGDSLHDSIELGLSNSRYASLCSVLRSSQKIGREQN